MVRYPSILLIPLLLAVLAQDSFAAPASPRGSITNIPSAINSNRTTTLDLPGPTLNCVQRCNLNYFICGAYLSIPGGYLTQAELEARCWSPPKGDLLCSLYDELCFMPASACRGACPYE